MTSDPTYNQCPGKVRSAHCAVSLHAKNGAVVKRRAAIVGGDVQLDPGAVGVPVNDARTDCLFDGRGYGSGKA